MQLIDSICYKRKQKNIPNWPKIPYHPYSKSINGSSGSRKTNPLFNLTSQQLDIDKIYLYPIDPFEGNYQFSFKERESTGLKHFNYSKAFIEYLNDMDDIY